ncbi:MAG: thioesterase family protein [Oscillospiraceae bacterium]|jgi:predicted thioesterase|nr:thioesterase family protein [Oscillospiraceae bacterium]
MKKISVTMATLESHNHIIDDIPRGVRVYNGGGVEFEEQEPGFYWARVPHKGGFKTVTVVFTRDGIDIGKHFCDCTWKYKEPPVCRHVVAAVLAIQGGVVDSGVTLGKTATISATVNQSNTAKAVGSGSLDVFATPMMIALMERAACECLADCLEPGQTSVGTGLTVSHNAASPVGAKITATATIERVFGRRIEFKITAADNSGEIGGCKHTRVIVDSERFMKKAEGRI